MAPFKDLLLFAIATATCLAQSSGDGDAQKPLVSTDECSHPPYQAHILSQSPLVIYLEGFLTPEERAHLTEVT